MTTQTTQQDSKDLKIQALLEKIGNMVASYENIIADYRVELTKKEQELEGLRSEKEKK